MALSEQIEAFPDCLDIFERALASKVGVRTRFDTAARAAFFQLRMHHFRALDRRQNKRIYPEHDPMWGKSAFDILVVRTPASDDDGFWWLYVERHGLELTVTEDLEQLYNETTSDDRAVGTREVRRIGFARRDEQREGDAGDAIENEEVPES